MKYSDMIRKIFYRVNGNFIDIRNTNTGKWCNFAHHCEIKNSIIGDRTSIGRYTKIENTITGKYCSISWNTTIGAPSHPIQRITSNAFPYRKLFGIVKNDKKIEQKTTNIGNDVWIGCNVVIVAGVTIGDGAIIGAGSVVTKDVSPYTIAAGVPARHIKNRYEDVIMKKIELLKWWDFDDSILNNNLELFEKDLDEETLEKLFILKERTVYKCTLSHHTIGNVE